MFLLHLRHFDQQVPLRIQSSESFCKEIDSKIRKASWSDSALDFWSYFVRRRKNRQISWHNWVKNVSHLILNSCLYKATSCLFQACSYALNV